ncbi:MAG: hypothetical protein Q4A78_04245 [Peptostreptococcaceae bacterium]|nr:hypothetical protein [Peptostreptococcaceae bacterium]
MNIREYLDKYFALKSRADEEGVYRYYLYEAEDEVLAATESPSAQIELVLECDDSNYFALVYLLHGRVRFMVEGTKLSGAAVLDNEYQDAEGNEVIEKGLILYSDAWAKRYLRIDRFPHLAVSMEIDYEEYETDENGAIIWE